MLKITAKGVVVRGPDYRTSAKGTPYLKFTLDCPNGQYSKKVQVTMFGAQASQLANQMQTPGYTLEVAGDPEAKAWQNKQGKLMGSLEMIGRDARVLAAPQAQASQAPQWGQTQEPAHVEQHKFEQTFGDEDIPF